MRTDKLAVLATFLCIGYLIFKQKGAQPAPHPAMPAPIVYHPPPHRQKIPIIFPPILGHRFPHPTPRPPPHFFRPPIERLPITIHPFPHPTPRRPPFE